MKIYIAGISGTGMGPLALMAENAGYDVCGSDLSAGAIYDELIKAGIEVSIGEQDGKFLQKKMKEGVDWFVYTSALPEDHAELKMAREAGIKCTKRDDLTEYLVRELGLKMVAVAGTHGKTTTTAMIIWAALKLELPVAYVAGTTLGFAASGAYHDGDKFFVYEADEYDRNFLKYHPWLAVIPAISYDHPDIYPTEDDYLEAFTQFKSQSMQVVGYKDDKIAFEKNSAKLEPKILFEPKDFKLAGEVRRIDAALAANAVYYMEQNEFSEKEEELRYDTAKLKNDLNGFPGVGRRFEKIADGVYTDYAHHPEEIEATMGVAHDECDLKGYKGIVVVYQPHQNTRQHEVREGYHEAFVGAEKLYWLPTYLTRENPELSVITPKEFIADLTNKEIAEEAELSDGFADKLRKYISDGYMVLLMTAGPADEWLRGIFEK